MGITCTLRRIDEEGIRRVRADPTQLKEYFDSDGGLENVEVHPGGLEGLLLRLLRIKVYVAKSDEDDEDDEDLAVRAGPPTDGDALDIDKSWHGLHFLFTGTTNSTDGEEPAGFLGCGGEDIGDEDEGYGDVRLFQPDQVAAIGSFLASVSMEELTQRYDPIRMRQLEVYPDRIWDAPHEVENSALDYLTSYFEALQVFVGRAAADRVGLLVQLT
jgi:hypothetical protein